MFIELDQLHVSVTGGVGVAVGDGGGGWGLNELQMHTPRTTYMFILHSRIQRLTKVYCVKQNNRNMIAL